MIKKPNKPSSDRFFLLAAFLLFTTVCLFVYAIFVNPFFSFILAFVFMALVSYLAGLQRQFNKENTRIELQHQDFRERINLLEADLHKETVILESLRKKTKDYAQLKGLIEKLGVSLSVNDTALTLSREVNRIFGHHDTTVIIYIFHSRTGELGIAASQKGQMQINIKSKKGDIFDQWVVKALQPLLVQDTNSDFRFDADKMSAEELRSIRSLISVPMLIDQKTIGILRVDSPQDTQFTMEDLRLLTTVGDLGAVAIENAQLYERLQDMAIRDSLTSLYLRRYLLERLPEEMSRALRGKQELSFLMMDLDEFKKYNDRFGHMAGDIVLKTVAMILTGIFDKPGELVCRYGGEEFCVLLPDCSKAQALSAAERVRKKIEGQSIVLRRQKIRMTISIGVAVFPRDAAMKEELIARADEALYQAKGEGRNRVCAV